MPLQLRELTIESQSPLVNGRADRGVQDLVGGSRSHVTGLFDHDCVTINDQTETNPGRSLLAGDRIQVRFEANRRYSPKRRPRQQHRGFSIVHEDAHIIVVEKSAELLTVPTDAGEPHTLQYRVNEHVKHEGKGRGAFIVHRLDRGVSGLLVFAKTKDDAQLLQDQFRQRKPERQYDAVVAGSVIEDNGEFRTHLATNKNLSRFSTGDEDDGELAITHYKVVQRFPGVTHVTVQLETGRRNQIRVHFSEARHPVIGDLRYRSDLWADLPWPFKRLALHASTLGFRHPHSAQTLRFVSPMPREMTEFLQFIQAKAQAGSPPKSSDSGSPRSAGGGRAGIQQLTTKRNAPRGTNRKRKK